MSDKIPDDVAPKKSTNLFALFADSVNSFINTCVTKAFPQVSTSQQPRPNAVVLLNAHGSYPYDLFENGGEIFTRGAKEKSFSKFTMRHNILEILSEFSSSLSKDEDEDEYGSSPLSQDVNNTLFNNVYYTSSVPVPYSGMMVWKIKDEDGVVIQRSSREVELDIVRKFVQKVFSPSRDKTIESIFTEMRMALRDNANNMYHTTLAKIAREKDNDMKEFLIYINSLIRNNKLYESYYPLCDTNLDKDYGFYPEENEDEDEVVPHHGFHIWIDNNYYDLFQESGYQGIFDNVISSIPDDNPKKNFAIYMLNNIIYAKMPNLKLSEISLFLWSLDLNDIIISDSACNLVIDMLGNNIVTNDNFKNTIGKSLSTLFPPTEHEYSQKLIKKRKKKRLENTINTQKRLENTIKKGKKRREDTINIKREKDGGKSTKKKTKKKTIKGKRRNKKESKQKRKQTKKESKQKRKQTKKGSKQKRKQTKRK